ncbi:MAG: PLP-dependent aspartate aminotransferase family protein, partial [Planctomycetota bacterium]
LEEGDHGLCFASGLASTDAVIRLLSAGDHVVAGDDLYGGTYRIFDQVYRRFGLEFDFVDASDLGQIEEALRSNTRLVWVETPTNPLLKIVDLSGLAKLSSQAGAYLAVDNTFATPYLQQPLKLGADIVVHSVTKYLGGHSDLVGGALIVKDGGLQERLAFLQNAAGAIPGPMDCFLALRGIKTLAVRLDRQQENATRIAAFLSDHSRVQRVYFPGLQQHPGHALAGKQMSGFGAMLSFTLKGESEEEARQLVSRTRIFSLAESLGGVESLIEHPVSMTHGSIPPSERTKAGLSDGLIRLSVGLEDIEDLLEDLDQALA